MDEAEKYKQRLEAIAEKRRLQEEQDRAKREMEDEKIRLHQLKRKSLRDQWLMEGPPLSPVSPDPHSPRSPLWGSPTKENENHVEKLLSNSQQLEEEKEQMEDGQVQEAVRVAEAAAAEMVHVVVVQNGESSVAVLESSEDEAKVKSPLHDGSMVVITNGGGDFSHSANGLGDSAEVVVSMKSEPASSLGTSEAETGRVPDVNLDEGEEEEEEEGEEEEGTLVIRAECVMITDEGEEAPEDVAPKEEEQETEESALLEPEETTEEMIKTESAPEAFTQPEGSEPSAEEQPRTEHGDVAGDVNSSEPEDPTSVRSAATGLEGAAVASVPVYTEMEPSTVAAVAEVEAAAASAAADVDAAAASPEGAQDPATESGRFQEVPLADPLENQRTEAGQGEHKGEQEPLLSQAAAPITQAEPEAAAAAAAAVNTETYSPNRASKGEEPTAPKRKTCQCCSIM